MYIICVYIYIYNMCIYMFPVERAVLALPLQDERGPAQLRKREGEKERCIYIYPYVCFGLIRCLFASPFP